jgi:hypothetical protein
VPILVFAVARVQCTAIVDLFVLDVALDVRVVRAHDALWHRVLMSDEDPKKLLIIRPG